MVPSTAIRALQGSCVSGLGGLDFKAHAGAASQLRGQHTGEDPVTGKSTKH